MSTPPCSPGDSTEYPYCICDRKPANTPFGISDKINTYYNVSVSGKKQKANKYCFVLAPPNVPLNTKARCASTPTLKKVEIHADYSKRFSVLGVSANGGKVKASWGNNILADTTIDYNTYKITELGYNKKKVAEEGIELCVFLDVKTPLEDWCIKDKNQYSICAVALFDVSQQCCPVYLASP
jgi:hypothetical protein